MRKIVAGSFMSLDGVVEEPQRWQFPYFNDEMAQALGAALAQADTLLLGRRTYEEFAAFWPHQTSDVPFADRMNAIPKVVASSTLEAVVWQNTTLVRGDVAEELRALKRGPGDNILINGSATLVRSLLRDGLVDEIGLLVCPVIVGRGARLFDDWSQQLALDLVDSTRFATGVISVTYRVAEH